MIGCGSCGGIRPGIRRAHDADSTLRRTCGIRCDDFGSARHRALLFCAERARERRLRIGNFGMRRKQAQRGLADDRIFGCRERLPMSLPSAADLAALEQRDRRQTSDSPVRRRIATRHPSIAD